MSIARRAARAKIVSDKASETVIHYTCADGGFGRLEMTLLTPRSLRVETQGISDGCRSIMCFMRAARIRRLCRPVKPRLTKCG